MKLKIIIVNILIFFIMGHNLVAEGNTFLLQRDKQQHIVLSAVLASAITAYARNQGSSKVEAFFYGAGVALAVGAIKEGLDGYSDDNERNLGDMGANVLGAAAGALISAQFEWKF